MDRRTFLAALAGVAAAPKLLEAIAPAPDAHRIWIHKGHQVGKTEAMFQEIERVAHGEVWILAPNQEHLLRELAVRGYHAEPWLTYDRPFAGRRLLVPVWTDRGIEEVVYNRAPVAHPLAHVAHVKTRA